MVQNSNNINSFGIVSKVGFAPNGRVVYQVTGADGKLAGNLSVAPQDCDTFEKSYSDMLSSAAKLQKYASTHTEDDMKKMKKASRWITGLSAFAGGAFFMFKKNIKKPVLKTIGGTLAGLVVGSGISLLTTTPPGSLKLAKVSKTISKLDIQPYQEK